MKKILCAVLMLSLVCLSSMSAFASGADTWIGNTATDLNTAANWSTVGGSTPPATGDTWTFNAAGSQGAALTSTLPAALSVGGITFSVGATGSTYVISGNSITLTGGITNSSTSLQTLNMNIATTTTNTITTTAGGGNITLGGNISGSGGAITMAGPGTLTLSGTNTYTGTTSVAAGTLNLTGSTGSSSTVAVGTAGTLTGNGTVNGNATLTGSGAINMSTGASIVGTLGVTGGNWNGVGTVTGAVTSSSGTFTIGNGANLTANGGLNVTGGTIASGNSSSTITGSVNYTSSSSSTFGGVIAGTGKTVTMNSSGQTLTLNGNNTYTGATTIQAGQITFGANLVDSALNFTGTGTAEFTSGVNVTNAITTNTTNQGIVTLDNGTHTLSADIGTANDVLNLVNVGMDTTTMNGNIYATTVTFTGNGGDLNLAAGKSISGVVTETVDGSSTLAFAGSTTVSNNVGSLSSGLAYIDFNGGTTTLSANIYTDPASQGGTGATTLASGATMNVTGNETIGGKFANNGILNIGSTTTTITNTYTQAAGSVLDLTANSPTAFGSISSSHAAAIYSASTINVTVGGYIPTGTSLEIINTSGAGIGSGGGIGVPTTVNALGENSFLTFVDSVSGGNLYITAERSSTGYAYIANNSNAKSLGNVLDNETSPNTDLSNILNTLESSSASQVAAALNTLIPTVDRGILDNSAAALNNFIGSSIDRIQSVFNLASSGKSSGVSAGDEGKLNGLWAKQYGSYLDEGTREGIEGYNAWNTGTAVGVDHLFNDDLTIGASLGYSYGEVNSDANNGNVNINSAQGTVYAGYQDSHIPYYVDLAGSIAENWYNGQRDITVDTINRIADSQYKGTQSSIYLEGGYKLDIANNIQVTPITSLQWTNLSINKYEETGAEDLDLNVKAQDYNTLESGLGASIAYPMKSSWGEITPELHAKWLYDFVNDNMSVTSSLAGGGGSFTTNGASPARDGANVGGKLTFDLKDDVSVIAGFDTEMRDQFFGVSGTISVRYKF